MANRLTAGLAAFFRTESAGAVVLLAATAIALLWANLSPDSYNAVIHTEFGLVAGSAELEMSLQHWINDAVMMLFFFLVTLEVKKDVVLGELRSWKRAALPIVGAVAGLVVPALIFVAITRGTPEVGAWGVVISTDTAFVVGILAAFGSRIPAQLRVFILALAVVDDIGALAVIAFFYTEDINLLWLGIAAALAAVTWFVQRMQAWRGLVYAILGVFLWFAVLQSGVHATIAGVILGLLLPVFPPKHQLVDEAEDLTASFRRSPNAERGMSAAEGILRSVSINDRFQLSLRRVVSLVIVPVFALVNAGVLITSESLSHAFGSALTWGVIAGLVVGKFVGIFGATMLGRRLHIGELSEALRARHIASGALLTGIGFTISLFIVDLAITDPVAQSDARIGILTGSALAALLGVVSLQLTARYDRKHAPARVQLNRPIDPSRDHIFGPADARNSLTVYGSFGGLDDARRSSTRSSTTTKATSRSSSATSARLPTAPPSRRAKRSKPWPPSRRSCSGRCATNSTRSVRTAAWTTANSCAPASTSAPTSIASRTTCAATSTSPASTRTSSTRRTWASIPVPSSSSTASSTTGTWSRTRSSPTSTPPVPPNPTSAPAPITR